MRERRSSRQLRTAILILLGILSLTVSSCHYQADFYPVYDVLEPGPEVDVVGFTQDGDIIVNQEFMTWVQALKQEIIRLRRELEECEE